ncbi:NmrA family transcriptional regulator, partial [Pseudomonas sp. SIMBA_041]
IAATSSAAIVAEIALAEPINTIVEIGGPERFSLSGLVQNYLSKTKDSLEVIEDNEALYFGSPLEDLTLVPKDDARLGTLTFEEWFP